MQLSRSGHRGVTFATYPSLNALYTQYQEIIDNLTKQHFTAVENTHVCDAWRPTRRPRAPGITRTLLHQLLRRPDGLGAGVHRHRDGPGVLRAEVDGSAIIVWTQDSGHLLGYATGSEASHEQVWEWFYAIHHEIIFPGQPAMSRHADVAAAPTTAMSAGRPLPVRRRRGAPTGYRGYGHQSRPDLGQGGRVGARAGAGEGGDRRRRPERPACHQAGALQVGPAEAVRRPPGEEAAAERVARADRVRHRDRRDLARQHRARQEGPGRVRAVGDEDEWRPGVEQRLGRRLGGTPGYR